MLYSSRLVGIVFFLNMLESVFFKSYVRLTPIRRHHYGRGIYFLPVFPSTLNLKYVVCTEINLPTGSTECVVQVTEGLKISLKTLPTRWIPSSSP